MTAGIARPITRYGQPVLHRPCAPVTTFDAGLADLVGDRPCSFLASPPPGGC